MNQRTVPLVLAALVLVAIALPAGADRHRPPLISEITVEREELAGIANVAIQQYDDDSFWVRSYIHGDRVHSDEEAQEWELIWHRDATCSDRTPHSANHLAHFHYGWSSTYGTRILTRYFPTFSLEDIGSVELVHDGPNFEDHADHSGRHHLACASVGPTGG